MSLRHVAILGVAFAFVAAALCASAVNFRISSKDSLSSLAGFCSGYAQATFPITHFDEPVSLKLRSGNPSPAKGSVCDPFVVSSGLICMSINTTVTVFQAATADGWPWTVRVASGSSCLSSCDMVLDKAWSCTSNCTYGSGLSAMNFFHTIWLCDISEDPGNSTKLALPARAAKDMSARSQFRGTMRVQGE